MNVWVGKLLRLRLGTEWTGLDHISWSVDFNLSEQWNYRYVFS